MGIKLIQGYGLTETAPVLSAERRRIMRKGSVGKAMKSAEIKICDPNENGIGEIIAKGPNIMIGYYENDAATRNAIKDGWFHTGDMGYMDSDGYLFITGRKKNVIVLSNGKNVYPEELEQLLNNIFWNSAETTAILTGLKFPKIPKFLIFPTQIFPHFAIH